MTSKKLLSIGLVCGAIALVALLAGLFFFWSDGSRFGGADRWGGYGGMMDGSGMGPGMMGSGYGYGVGPGMMGGDGASGAFGGGPSDVATAPLSLDQAAEAAGRYLEYWGNSDLRVVEVLEFTNGFYVRVDEQSNLAGSLELIVERNAGVVSAASGPNLVWNTKYGVGGFYDSVASGTGRSDVMGRGMMGRGYGYNQSAAATTDMPVDQDDASQRAQQFLDRQLPGTKAGEIDTFYGYHTVKVESGDRVLGLLAVNGYYGKIWYYSWTGAYLNGKKS